MSPQKGWREIGSSPTSASPVFRPLSAYACPHSLENAFAGLFAAAARFRAEPAVLVHLGMALALRTADTARFNARFELLSNQGHVRLGQPRQYVARRVANVGTVEV